MADQQRLDDLRRRVQRDPASIAFAQLAEELRRAGRFRESIAACRAGLANHPGYVSARVTLGRALIDVNQLEPARAELEHVLQQAPENLAALRGLGEIHHRRGAHADALRHYRRALVLAPRDPDLNAIVAELTAHSEPAVATTSLADDSQPAIAPHPASTHRAAFAVVSPSLTLRPVSEAVASTPVSPSGRPSGQLPIDDETAFAMFEPDLRSNSAARDRAARTVAVLEQWLDAIHVARAHRRA
jgi:tetratricopeptide (TPR) repeat protein